MVRLSKELLAKLPRPSLRKKPVLLAMSAGSALAILLSITLLAGWTEGLDRRAYDLRQRVLARGLPDGLVIVGADGLGDVRNARARRSLLQGFIERARNAGASVIVLDLDLLEDGPSPASDSALARTLAAGADVVLAAEVGAEGPTGDWQERAPARAPRLPAAVFSEAAAGVGFAARGLDPDSVVRRTRPRSHILGMPFWSLAVEALRVHRDVPFEEVALSGGLLYVGGMQVPTGREYYIDHRRVRPPLSMENLMRGSTLPDRARPLFENAIVLIGETGPGAETVATPLDASIPRIFVHASEVATLLRGPIRHDVPLGPELLLVWLLAVGGAAVFFQRSPGTGVVVWTVGWALLLAALWAPFAAGWVLGVTGLGAWGLVFPMAMAYRLHASGVDVLARDRSIQAIARLRNIRFEDHGLGQTVTPLLETLGGALDAHSVLLLQEGNEFWEVVGGIGAPPKDWNEFARIVSQTDGEPLLDASGREAFVPIVVDQDSRRRVLYVRGSRNLGALDTHTLLSVAAGLHLGLQNRALTRSLEEAYLGILTAISITVEARDQGTEAHCQRLATYSCVLAHELGYPVEFLEDLWVGATLHDIGKVGIPDAILLKPAKLSRKEFETMKQHTVLGHRILEESPISETAKMCVLHHHERWDGKGYPEGLAGEEIPRGARIVTVVDIFDALTAERAYRKAKPEDEALEFIEGESGAGLEAELVDCFLELYRSGIIRGASNPIPESARRRWSPRRDRSRTNGQPVKV